MKHVSDRRRERTAPMRHDRKVFAPHKTEITERKADEVVPRIASGAHADQHDSGRRTDGGGSEPERQRRCPAACEGLTIARDRERCARRDDGVAGDVVLEQCGGAEHDAKDDHPTRSRLVASTRRQVDSRNDQEEGGRVAREPVVIAGPEERQRHQRREHRRRRGAAHSCGEPEVDGDTGCRRRDAHQVGDQQLATDDGKDERQRRKRSRRVHRPEVAIRHVAVGDAKRGQIGDAGCEPGGGRREQRQSAHKDPCRVREPARASHAPTIHRRRRAAPPILIPSGSGSGASVPTSGRHPERSSRAVDRRGVRTTS